MIEMYTDGACSSNGAKENFGGYSVVVVKNNLVRIKIQKGIPNTTNNEMELMGVLTAIKLGKIINEKDRNEIIIYSDSAYVVNTINSWMSSWANNGWIKKSDKKAPENLKIIQEIYSLMTFERNIKIHKIKGHDSSIYNNLADTLAVEARENLEKEYLKNIGKESINA